jgi:uncharacterized damage-inducible protein DinB
MSITTSHLLELEKETANTKAVISKFRDQDLSFKPHEKSMTVQELVSHVVDLHNWVAHIIKRDQLDFHTDYTPVNYTTIQEAVNTLEENYNTNKTLVANVSEADWMKTWTLKAGGHIIAEAPKTGLLRFIVLNHIYHHRGQLTVYLRLLGLPVPGIYGPSADEPFGG